MIGFKGVGSFEETVRAGISDLFVPSVLVLAPRDLDEYFQSRTGLTVAHFLQFHTYCGLFCCTFFFQEYLAVSFHVMVTMYANRMEEEESPGEESAVCRPWRPDGHIHSANLVRIQADFIPVSGA